MASGALLRRLLKARDLLHADVSRPITLDDLAKRALARGASVTAVCHDVGFESLGTFSTSFRKRVGLSPRAYQQVTRPFVQSLGVPILYIPSCFLSFEHV
jgi:AraC-like DNA-binding protein